ncbi:glycosyltransferase [Fusobacterium varium]|uniref:glycosyltransferase n=1 Tax=Fusobacterium varium TaxID=856 RepID=UPI0022E06DA6|nr:glycosyltransferase [Fusobacterium varium]
MKKILFYTSGVGLGGVEKVILEILQLIDKSKFDIKLGLQYENENLFENEIPEEIKVKYMLSQEIINKSLYFRERKKNIFYKFCYSLMLNYERYVIKKNYLKFSKDRDIVIDFKSGDFLKLINFKNGNRKKRVCWIHGEIKTLNAYKKRKEILEKNLEKCQKIICICEEMKERFIQELPNLSDKIQVIYNPFDIIKIKNLSDNYSEVNEDEKKLLKENYIIMVSRLESKMKDFFTLIDAFKLVKEKKPEMKLFILGDGPDREKIKEKIKEKDLEKEIILLGMKKNPYPWIKNANLLVHSSNYEGLPTVLIEGLILNKIIISTDCPTGPKEILKNGKYGSLVTIGDYKTMASEIEELSRYNSLKRKKYLELSEEAVERFDGNKIIIQIEKLLENL